MLNSISRACIQQAVNAGSLYVTTTISVVYMLTLSHKELGLGTDLDG